MADSKKAKDAEATVQDDAEAAKAAGRTPQVTETAAASGDAAKIEAAARSEDAPKPDPDTEKNPAADANPTETLGPSDSGPNQMSTAGLNAIQRARVEGTPIDGTNGHNFVQQHPDVGAAPRASAQAKSGSRGKR